MAGGLPEPILISELVHLDHITIAGQTVEFRHVFYTWMAMLILFVVGWLGSQTMSGIGITRMFDAISFPPVVVVTSFAFFGKIHGTQVVYISSLHVHDSSEYSLAGHIESC